MVRTISRAEIAARRSIGFFFWRNESKKKKEKKIKKKITKKKDRFIQGRTDKREGEKCSVTFLVSKTIDRQRSLSFKVENT